jgi:hypothetical protein
MQYKVTLYTNKSLGGITVEGQHRPVPPADRRAHTPQDAAASESSAPSTAGQPSYPPEARATPDTEEEQAEWAAWKAKHDAEYRKKQLGIALDAVTKHDGSRCRRATRERG